MPDFKNNLYKYIGKITSLKNWHLLAIGGIANHIHILIQKAPRHTISEVVCRIKSNSSKFMREYFITEFAWQNGYSAFTVDAYSLPRIKKYISNQKQHHSKITFEKEYVLLLEHYKIKYNKQVLFK